MSWNSVLDILMPIGTIVGIVGGFLGVLTYIKSLRKPKARLRFADGKKEITLTPHYYHKTSTKYYIVPYPELDCFDRYHALGKKYQEKHEADNAFILSFQLYNNGELQLENYRVEIEYDKVCQLFIHRRFII